MVVGMTVDTEAMITVRQLAAALQISPDTVYRLAQSGEITAARIGRIWRFRLSDVEAALAAALDPWQRSPQSAGRRRLR